MADVPDTKAAAEFSSSMEKANKAMKEFRKKIHEVADTFKDIADITENVASNIDESSEFTRKELNDINQMNRNLGVYVKKGIITVKQAIKLDKTYRDIIKRQKAIDKIETKTARDWKKRATEEKKLDLIRERFAQRIEELQGVEKLKEWGSSWKKNVWGNLTQASRWISARPDIVEVLKGGAAKGISMLTGRLGKFAGPAGAVTAGVKALWDMGMAADDFVKTANKAFAKVRGPDIMTKDIEHQFEEFNNQIFKTGENITVGLNVQEIRSFMEALDQAGYRITQLNTGLTTYRDAIYIAAKASRTLSMELPRVASIMGELLTDFRMDMKQIDDTFVQVAFDARKSGLSTEKFWQAIQSASASLALYGVFINKASKALSAYTKTGVMGAQETAEMVGRLTQTFARMDSRQRAVFAGLVANAEGGREALEKAFSVSGEMFEERLKETGKALTKAKERKAKLEEEGASIDAIEAVKDEIVRLENLQANLVRQMQEANLGLEAIKKGNYLDVAPYLPIISGNIVDLFSYMVKAQVGGWTKLQGQTLILLEQIAEAAGFGKENIYNLVSIARQTDNRLRTYLGLQGDAPDSIINALANNADKLATSDEETNEVFIAKIENILDDNQRRQFKEMVKLDKSGAFIRTLRNVLKSGTATKDVLKQQLNANWDSMELADNYVNLTHEQTNTTETMKKRADETFKQIVKQTLSFKEMQQIAEEEAHWRLYSLNLFQQINKGVFDILREITKKEETPAQEEASKNLAVMAKNYKDFAKYIKKGKITLPGQTAVAKEVATLPTLIDELTEANEKGDTEVATKLDEQIKTLTAMKQQITILNPDLIEVQELIARTHDENKETAKQAKRDLVDKLDAMATIQDKGVNYLADELGISFSEIVKIYSELKKKKMMYTETIMGQYGIPTVRTREIPPEVISNMIPGAPGRVKSEATLNVPEIVTAPGVVKLDPGEVILPKEYSKFRSIPALGDYGPAGNARTGGNWNVTINAIGLTPKEFAEKVRNEMLAVRYRERLMGG